MSRNLTILSAFVLAFPIAIEAPYDSGGASGHATRISVGGGAGYYALITRDCEGNAIGSRPVTFRDVGADVEQQVHGPLHLGVRGGAVREDVAYPEGTPYPGGSQVQSARYVNPYLALESRHVGIGWGPIFSKESPAGDPARYEGHTPLEDAASFSGHLRLGGPNKYFSTSLMENVPLSSGGGYFDMGVGFRPRPTVDWWIGLSAAPYDRAGAAFRTAWQMNPRWTLDASARLGVSGGEPQTGVALGVTSRFGRPSGKALGPVPAPTPPGAP
jgi:hypothetical protein